MFLCPEALRNLKATASRRRTERQAMEDALELLAAHDTQMDSMQDFIDWATAEWGEPSADEKHHADNQDAALAQAWRDPSRQLPMAMLVKATTVYPFGDPKTIGRRCALTKTNDVVDASLAVLADQLGLSILTTDPKDMAQLEVAFQAL